MKTINTPITRLLNIKTPIISAAMAGASGGELAARVSSAGGFGFMAVGYDDERNVRKELDIARSILQHGNDAGSSPTPNPSKALQIGVGFLGWKLDEQSESGLAKRLLTVVLEARVAAVWLSFGNDLGKWIQFIREFDNKRSDPHKTLIFVLVNYLYEARVAIDEWKVDVLVAQGIESGGHGQSKAPSLIILVSDILHEFPNGLPPLLGAGGLVSGTCVAALLALGASGAVFGTRFVVTPESLYVPEQKAALCAAKSSDTIRTTVFDILRGTSGWPLGIDGRALRNETVERIERGEDLEEIKCAFEKATKNRDPSGMLIWSGASIGRINDIKPAADVVTEIHEGLLERLQALSTLL